MIYPVSNYRIQRIVLILLPVLLFSCGGSEKEKSTKGPFPLYPDFKKEIQYLDSINPRVKKTLKRNSTEEVVTDTINWEKEFSIFIEADINKPEYRDSYKKKLRKKNDSIIITFAAIDTSLAVQKAVVKRGNGRLLSVFIKRKINSRLYSTYQELYYEPRQYYSISSYQKVAMAFEKKLEVTGEILSDQVSWRFVLDLGAKKLPFKLQVAKNKDGKQYAVIINGKERLKAEDLTISKDSFNLELPVFQSEIKAKFIAEGKLSGIWHNHAKGEHYQVPVAAEINKSNRFRHQSRKKYANVEGKWKVDFSPGTEDHYPSIGIFKQKKAEVTGTFMTETGDYRFLEGTVTHDSLFLSCFDGAHAFLFEAAINDDQLHGTFWSGNHWKENWTAKRDEDFELANPDSLTYLKEGYKKLSFAFPDLDSNLVSLEDEKYRGKVVIVQIMGSWCPNCMDETAFLSELYEKYNPEGLEIIALAFERSTVFNNAKRSVEKHRDNLNAGYDFLIAGKADKEKAAEALPMLNHIISYPTSIFIDRKGQIRKIHTGFNGPGTGERYKNFTEEIKKLIEDLLKEKPPSQTAEI